MDEKNTDFILFKQTNADGVVEEKNLSSLFEDIYNNSSKTKNQITKLLKEVATFIVDGDSARELVPVIKEYLEVSVKNDEQLVKLASIVQKIIQIEARTNPSENEFGLTDAEKESLLKDLKIDVDVDSLQKDAKSIEKEIEKMTGSGKS